MLPFSRAMDLLEPVYWQVLIDTFNVTGPIFILILVGLALRRAAFIDDHFVQVSSRLVFSLCLPLLLFTTISDIELNKTIDLDLIYFALLATLGTFLTSSIFTIAINPRSDRGVFVQGAFRSNLGVIGLALCENAYGPTGFALASLLMAVLTVAYNVLSVLTLSYYANQALAWRKVFLDIVTNPLIVAIVLAALVSVLQIPIPDILRQSGEYLGGLALPLALLGTGASMNLRVLRHSGTATLGVVLLKTLLLPASVALAAISMGFSSQEIGILFLLFVSPTATASYVMVKTMGGNDVLAANLIMVTTLIAIVTASFGLFLLRANGYG